MPNNFDALQDSSSSSEDEQKADTPATEPVVDSAGIPSYEDLSSTRADEETVLQAVYGEDFSMETGTWGRPRWHVNVHPHDDQGSRLILRIQLGKQYPYVAPMIELSDVHGLLNEEKRTLDQSLQQRAQELRGSVMVMELVQIAEDFCQEHNRNPNLSAWDQMKVREAEEAEKERKAAEELHAMMDREDNVLSPQSSITRPVVDASSELERELNRQREALNAASKKNQPADTLTSNERSGVTSDDDENDDFDFMEDDYNVAQSSASRYESDFVELGVLGRGGGGEVVKVRNRLDRRIYAVKKIVLENESGSQVGLAAIQNRKLRREVTTISRMTHKNIVRYYQAWVEGGTETASNEMVIEEEEESGGDTDEGESLESDSSSKSTSSPTESHLLHRLQERQSSDQVESDFNNETTDDQLQDGSKTSESIVNILEHELDYDFQSPLMSGLGFHNGLYDNMIGTKKKSKGSHFSEEDSNDDWDDSSVKVNAAGGHTILYIQMEYCATTLRKLITDRVMEKMELNDKWRLIRQILEALAYIHSRKIVHRDVKPENLFLSDNRSDNFLHSDCHIRLGDFGLATRHKSGSTQVEDNHVSELETAYEGMDDIRTLLGEPALATPRQSEASAGGESMTGGVGTLFYQAPEQGHVRRRKGEPSYTVQADIFSLGIVLFEMFSPPFPTYMERAGTLTTLRGDKERQPANSDFAEESRRRFPEAFIESAPESVQRLIIWCLNQDPKDRPTAAEILSSDILPRKIELEQKYLEEALDLLTSSQSESHLEILKALFARGTPEVVETMFDTDVAARANTLATDTAFGRTPSQDLVKAISDIRAGALDPFALRSLAMSSASLVAATTTLRRARRCGKVGRTGKGMLKRASQRTCGIFAMRAAAAAAVTGTLDGVFGSDPVIVQKVCNGLKQIFESHGAAHMKSPLMRPRPRDTHNVTHVAQVINPRGAVLVFPEDLTSTFARSIGRGGTATSQLKRFDIDRVYHKSMTGGHPREALEATFDIVHDDSGKTHLLEAEALLVATQATQLLPQRDMSFLGRALKAPLWYIRINHTRLADAIMDLCGVATKESLRKICLNLLSRYTSIHPGDLEEVYYQSRVKADDDSLVKEVQTVLNEACTKHDLSNSAAQRLLDFVVACRSTRSSCSIQESISGLKRALSSLRSAVPSNEDPRRLKRLEDAARSLRVVLDVCNSYESILCKPLVDTDSGSKSKCIPLYIALDLGLRQRRKNYHGGILFQCIVLPDAYFDTKGGELETHAALISPTGSAVKIAEGGEYSDLVRKNRPPGNFASVLVHSYTSAPIPHCVGVRFSIGKFVELIYVDAAIACQECVESKTTIDESNRLDALRRSIGHPLDHSQTVQCIVASADGLDAATSKERFVVAATLWKEGISAEYLPQSSVILSLARRFVADTDDSARGSDWSLLELSGVCALLRIPFVVIVQEHLLETKRSVRLRQIDNDNSEIFVSLDDLASTILGLTSSPNNTASQEDVLSSSLIGTRDAKSTKTSTNPRSVDCIYIEHDHYYGHDNQVHKSETPHWKSYMKTMKMISMSADSFLSSWNDASALASIGVQAVPVFAVADVSFWVLRDFGTTLMKREQKEQSAQGACKEMIEKHDAKHKRSLRTLGTAMDSYMRRFGIWSHNGTKHSHSTSHLSSNVMIVLLYSKVDDRFDMISLSCSKGAPSQSNHKRR